MANGALITSMGSDHSRVFPVSALLANISGITGTGESSMASETHKGTGRGISELSQGPGSAISKSTSFVPGLIRCVGGLGGERAEGSTFTRDTVIDLCVS